MARLKPGRARGFTLSEALIALALVGMVAVAMLPGFVAHLDTNTRDEVRSGAVDAAHERLEALRLEPPAAMPQSGSTAPQLVEVDGRSYEVVTHYCELKAYCDANRSRHIRVEVRFDGKTIFDVQTVYTELL
jgi:prepilin-type N-terminal cleavage/methylation domain-containing protein